MEVKTQEVIRYIDLRFKEQDLKDLISELDSIGNHFSTGSYTSDKEFYKNLVKIKEFHKVVSTALNEIRK